MESKSARIYFLCLSFWPRHDQRACNADRACLLAAYERQSHTARLRQELSRSKAEQSDYLRNVELARVIEKRKERKAVAAGKDGTTTVADVEVGDSKGKRTYEQRGRQTGGAEDGGKRKKWKGAKDEEGSKKQLDSVLGSIF